MGSVNGTLPNKYGIQSVWESRLLSSTECPGSEYSQEMV